MQGPLPYQQILRICKGLGPGTLHKYQARIIMTPVVREKEKSSITLTFGVDIIKLFSALLTIWTSKLESSQKASKAQINTLLGHTHKYQTWVKMIPFIRDVDKSSITLTFGVKVIKLFFCFTDFRQVNLNLPLSFESPN